MSPIESRFQKTFLQQWCFKFKFSLSWSSTRITQSHPETMESTIYNALLPTSIALLTPFAATRAASLVSRVDMYDRCYTLQEDKEREGCHNDRDHARIIEFATVLALGVCSLLLSTQVTISDIRMGLGVGAVLTIGYIVLDRWSDISKDAQSIVTLGAFGTLLLAAYQLHSKGKFLFVDFSK